MHKIERVCVKNKGISRISLLNYVHDQPDAPSYKMKTEEVASGVLENSGKPMWLPILFNFCLVLF